MKFRTEILWGEGYREAADVMAHEIFVLQNTDILETISATILKGTSAGKELMKLSKVMCCEMKDEVLEKLLIDALEDKEVGIRYISNVLEAIRSSVGKEIKYALWLCDSIEDIKEEYDFNYELDDSSFDAYMESDVVLSDLGRGGKLYGYEEMPCPCNYERSIADTLPQMLR